MDESTNAIPAEIVQAQTLANLFDSAITIPILRIQLGLDFLLGLIPVVGDFLMLLLSFRIIHLGKVLGMPKVLIRKMVINTIIDTAIGIIPFIGDILDVFYAANQRNVRLMEKWWLSANNKVV